MNTSTLIGAGAILLLILLARRQYTPPEPDASVDVRLVY